MPKTSELLTPIRMTIPFQFVEYHAAVYRVPYVGRPRNLAKRVTVE